MTRATQLFDFNLAATLISFILFGKWLENSAKTTADAIASMLALQVPTALLVEKRVECWFNVRLMPNCS